MPANLVCISGQSVAVGATGTQAAIDAYLLDNGFSIAGILYQASLDGISNPPNWNPDRTWGPLGLRAQFDGNTVIGPAIDMLRRFNDVEPGQWCGMTFACSSSSLAVHWNPFGSYPSADPKNLFNQYIDAIKAAEDAQNATFRCDMRFQFEADASNVTTANAWANNMIAYRDALWSHFPDAIIIIARPNILSSTAYGVSVIRPAVDYLATLPGFAMVDMDPYEMMPDFVHYPVSSNLQFGRAFADKWFLVEPLPYVDQLDDPASTILQIDHAMFRLFNRRALQQSDIASPGVNKVATLRGITGTGASADIAMRTLGVNLAAAIRGGTVIP